jgi:hypothetical protein
MFLVLRSLWEPARGRGGAYRRHPRRIAQWSEVDFPFLPIPKAEDVVIVGTEPITLNPQIAIGEVVAEVALFDYEIAALIEVMGIDKEITDLQQLEAQITALDKALAPFPDWSSIEITRSLIPVPLRRASPFQPLDHSLKSFP